MSFVEIMVVDALAQRIWVAVLRDGRLTDIFIDEAKRHSLAGNVYVGLVKNVLPGQFAFLDIGEGPNGFLQLDGGVSVKPGAHVLVQVKQDGQPGQKGPALSTQISLAGNFMVLLCHAKGEINVSKKIEDLQERKRLKAMLAEHLPHRHGVILRTQSRNKPLEALLEELNLLSDQAEKIDRQATYIKAPALIWGEKQNIGKILTHLSATNFSKIIANTEEMCEEIKEALGQDGHIVQHYTGEVPIFEEYFIKRQIEKALEKKVWLKSGGFLMIEETEACVVIDVNSGNQRQAALKTNLEAAKEIAYQLRLRNLSGMIMVDFIDLREKHEQEQLVQELKEHVKSDSMPVSVLGMGYLGVVQLTRKKVRQSLANTLLSTCPICKGVGKVKF